jgi:hypothetical protein
MTNNRKIKDLTEQQLIELIQSSIKGNFIEVSGVQINSTTARLEEVEKIINRLIEKHKDFLLLRKELKLKTGFTD